MNYLKFYFLGFFNLFYMYIVFNFSAYTLITVAGSDEANSSNAALGPRAFLYLLLFLIILSSMLIYWSFKYRLPVCMKIASYFSLFILLWISIAIFFSTSLANELFLFPFVYF